MATQITANNSNSNDDTNTTIELQLGDIIRIKDPTNEILNDNIFLIDYIDKTKLRLISEKELNKTQLPISPTGVIGDGTITEIELLYRNDELGYARQNGLLPGTWVNIRFAGDIPFVLTGEITNIEEDMIEIKPLGDDSEPIYINFDYKGLPEDLPIDNIEIRPEPEIIKKRSKEREEEEGAEYLEEREEGEEEEGEAPFINEEISVDEDLELGATPNIGVAPENRRKRKQMIIEADQIEFGDYQESIQEFKDIDKMKYRYNIDIQTNDLLEQMLSNIPFSQRTNAVLNNIHTMIARFIQLREIGSTFDKNKNIIGILKKDALDKPLANYLSTFQNKLYWILLVAKNNKKVYDVNEVNETNNSDITVLETMTSIQEINELFINYKSNASTESQNRYTELYNSLNPQMTPFITIDSPTMQNIICTHEVDSDMNTIVDNLGDAFSSVVSNQKVISRRFVSQRYNTGLTKLEAINLKGSQMTSRRVPLTRNDALTIQSVLTLPEPTVHFSQINLPGSSIFTKSNLNLHFLNYWQLLKRSSNVNPVEITNLDTTLSYDENNFVDNIKNFILNLETRPNISESELYEAFLKIIIPKIKVLFQLVKKYINGKLSLLTVISYLEPFMIYSQDLTYMQYVEINKFIRFKISEYNKNFVENGRRFALLKTLPLQKLRPSIVLELLNSNNEIKGLIEDKYQTNQIPLTNSELLKKITLKDFGNLYNTSVAFENIALVFPNELSSIFDLDKNKLHQTLVKHTSQNKCITYVISKQYNYYEDLIADNGGDIYFDKKHDDTPYDIINEFSKERFKLSPEEFMLFLTDKLHKKYKYNPSDAEYIAESLINGVKRVKEGQYATLVEETTPDQMSYYVRTNNEWVKDTNIDPELMVQEPETLCLIQPDCITNDKDTCESLEMSKDTILNQALKEIMDQFDKKYEITKEDLTKKINKFLEKYTNVFNKIENIEKYNFYKYNNQQYEQGLKAKESANIPVSPYARLRDIIMGQSDFVKKQTYIIRFVTEYCREPYTGQPNIHDNELESIYWLYCTETNTKLLPTFVYTLASTYVRDPGNYNKVQDTIIKEQGKLSDDGDSWVDQYSGYVIKAIDWDVEEGYDEGFKIRSRDILEQDLGAALISASQKRVKLLNPQSQAVLGMIQSMASFVGISIDNQSEFIINLVTNMINDTNIMASEKTYNKKIEEMAKKGKKIPEYSVVYNSTFLFLTLGAFLIGIQTSMPSVKTKKTFPGCVRSFAGFPLEGEGNMSAVNYIACVAQKIKSETTPWNVLKKMKEDKIAENIKNFTAKYLLTNEEVINKIKEKLDYLLVNPEEEIPEEHDIIAWTNFLPPLRRFHIRGLQNISDSFIDLLLKDIRMGSSHQSDKILVIQSKIIEFSFAIQESIQKIVDKKDLLLKNSIHPYMDNACCNEKGGNQLTTLQYFEKDDNNISQNNVIVEKLSNFINDINILTQASIFLSSIDTKRKYTFLSSTFSENTIYQAFILYCNFNSIMPIRTDLLSLCKEKPDIFSFNDTIEEQIEKLKREGQTYSHSALLRLLQIVSRNNVVDINLQTETYSQLQPLRDLLSSKLNGDCFSKTFIELLEGIMDTYDISVTTDTKDMRELKNYLDTNNGKMKKRLLEFIKQRGKLQKNQYNNIEKFIQSLSIWEFDNSTTNKISDDAMYNYLQFFKTFIDMIGKVFPTMILNRQQHTIQPPKYWGLSSRHNSDIINIVTSYYKPIEQLYGETKLENILVEIQRRCQDVLLFAKETPAFTEISTNDSIRYSVFDKRTSTLLYEYYLLILLTNYIDLSDNPYMIKREAPTEEEYGEEEESYVTTLEPNYISGDMNVLKEKTAKLLVGYIRVMMESKDIINVSYETVMDQVFKIKEREKDTFTDRLKDMTDEARNVDTILKINKLGVWGKGLAKGIKEYDPENYDQERDIMAKIAGIEKTVRKNNPNADEMNMDMLVQDYMEDMNADAEEDEERRMDNMLDDFMDGYDYNEREDEDGGQYD